MQEDVAKVEPAVENPPAPEKAPEQEKPPVSRRKKIIRRVLLGVAAALAVLVIFLLLFLDITLKTTVCNAGPYFTGTPIQMESLRISPFRGAVTMRGFTVGNPEGFSHENIFEMGYLVCDVDVGSLLGPEVVVEEITIQGLMVAFEPSLTKGSNVAVLQKNIESRIGKAGDAEEPADEPADEPAEDSGKPAKKVVIRKLRVEGIELATVGGVKIPLAPIVLNDLGGGSAAEAIDQFLTELLLSVSKVFSEETMNAIGGSLQDAGKNIGESLKGGTEQLSGALQDAGKNIGESLKGSGEDLSGALEDAGKNIGESLKGIFGN